MSANRVSGVGGSAAAIGSNTTGSPSRRAMLWVLGLVGAGVTLLIVLSWQPAQSPRADAAALAGLLVSTATAGVVIAAIGFRRGIRPGLRWLAAGFLVTASLQAALWFASRSSLALAPGDGNHLAGALGLLLAVSLGGAFFDLSEHVRRGRAEIVSDITLVAALFGGIAYLTVSGGTQSATHQERLLTAGVAFAAVLATAGWWVLTMWVPSRLHLGLTACATALGGGGLWVAFVRAHRSMAIVPMGPAVLASAAVLGMAALYLAPIRSARRARPNELWWVRPSLLTVSLGGACITLGIALMTAESRGGGLQSGILLGFLVLLVAVRSFMSQGAVTRTSVELGQALAERESALQSVQKAVAEVASSEARLRLLLDAAVDGVVELDANGTVVRANGAFCEMVRLPADDVIGSLWSDVARRTPGAGESMAELPSLGEAELVDSTRTTYLEARSSVLPGDLPGTLLLIRDVTSTKVADQTIRTLFQFLQDRDEDRSRLLRQANQTIEAERNRIARDLHDGPIQGISGATLSIEAAKIMVDRGDVEGAADMLGKIRTEISEEAENLRRLMGNLRPPVLEERGLIPAVREMCERFQRDTGITVQVQASGEAAVPDDTEILAYRVVQEALSNITKHSGAADVVVRVQSTAGTLEVEVEDDGKGFDPSLARDFLRKGKVGLASMRERTELGAGTFTIRSSPGRGTTVTAALPYDLLLG